MTELTTWLERQAKRRRRVVHLEDALLGDRFLAYALYRLRFFWVRYATECGVQVARFLVLYRILSRQQFYAILLLHAGAGVVNSFWWGALEVMRGRIRRLQRSGRPRRIPVEIGSWLSLSCQLGCITVIGAAAWAAWQAGQTRAFGAADVYVVTVLLQIACDFPSRCYHSGVYAIRRIYRPLSAILVIELATFLCALSLWPLIAAWSLPVAAMTGTAVSTTLIVRYTARAYRFLGMAPTRFVHLVSRRLPLRGQGPEAAAAGLSNIGISMDSILVIALFTQGGHRRLDSLFVLFYLLGPTVRAGVDWARLFYFDLMRLETAMLGELRRRFETCVFRLSLLLGLVFWALGCVITTAVLGGHVASLFGLMGIFFVSRSVLAQAQIRAFVAGAYATLLLSGAVFVIGVAALHLAVRDQQLSIMLLAAITFAALCVLLLGRARASVRASGGGTTMWPSQWLMSIRSVEEPVRIGIMRLTPVYARGKAPTREHAKDDHWQRWEIARCITSRLRGSGHAAVMSRDRIVWYQSARSRTRPDEEWLITVGAGLVEWIKETDTHSNGLAALEAAALTGLLGEDLRDACKAAAARPITVEQVSAAFATMFPKGIAYSPREEVPNGLTKLRSEMKRKIMSDVDAFAKDFQVRKWRSRFEVTVLFVTGELQLMFLVDRRVDGRLRSRWRAAMRRLNLENAVGSATWGRRA